MFTILLYQSSFSCSSIVSDISCNSFFLACDFILSDISNPFISISSSLSSLLKSLCTLSKILFLVFLFNSQKLYSNISK